MDNLSLFINICSHLQSLTNPEMKTFFQTLLNEFDEITALRFFAGGFNKLRQHLSQGQLKRIEEICLAIVTKRPPKSTVEEKEKKNEGEDDCKPVTIWDIARANLSLTFQYLPVKTWINVQQVCREFCIVARRPSSRTYFGECIIQWKARDRSAPMRRVCSNSFQRWQIAMTAQYPYYTNVERFYNFSHVQKFSMQLVPFVYGRPLSDHLLLGTLKHLTHLQYSACIDRPMTITPIPFLKNLQKMELFGIQWKLMMPLLAEYLSQHNLTHILIAQCTWRFSNNHKAQLEEFLSFILPKVLIE